MERIAVIDFETTGLSPAQGDRATEIAAVILEGGRVVDRYQSLMNAGVRIPTHIEALTGISHAMIRQAPPAAEVMGAVADFVGDCPLAAHNAAFDTRFWDAELARVARQRRQEFACSLLLARRLLPDAEMAASLLLRLEGELRTRHGVGEVSHALLRKIQAAPKTQLERCLAAHRETAGA